MNNGKYIFLGMCIGLSIISFMAFCHTIYDMGYYSAMVERDGHLYAIKKRTFAQGNILQYPFASERGKTAETGGSDSIQQSGATETKETKE